jgi:hypothetical protein
MKSIRATTLAADPNLAEPAVIQEPGRSVRIDVQVATPRDVTVISWEEREQLLERLRPLEGAANVVRRFEAVGPSRPVKCPGA